jgi:catechol 2,3-dioxygenase-like lactoylglutathione lyase family enzyme
MPLQRMEHYLVLTEDIERTKDFYCDGLGMTVGFRPRLSFPGYWVYLGDTPCIHIAERHSYEKFTDEMGIPFSSPSPSTGPIDHIAFNATGFDEMLTRLRRAGIAHDSNTIADIGLRQLFIKDPNGVTIELNFKNAA